MDKTLTEIPPFCRVEHLNVAFSGRAILTDVNVSLQRNKIVVLMGASGSGKTTFLRALNRLNEWYPEVKTTGRVMLDLSGTVGNIYAKKQSVTELRRQVGMVFQSPNVLPASIAKNICLPLKLVVGLDATEVEKRMVEALKEVHLWAEVKDRLHDSASRLSGGQQQRLCLARTLALQPQLLLLDEPTASLDFKATQAIEELLLELKNRYQIVAVSHSLRQSQYIGQQILVMNRGEITQQLTPRELEQPERLMSWFNQLF